MTGTMPKHSSDRRRLALAVGAAFLVIAIDGFDSFSLSLVAPKLAPALQLPLSAMGAVLAGAMGGMILGAVGGGALADRTGRLRTLLIALLLFGTTALLLPLAGSRDMLIANRVVAGVGLGAAAPIAVGLLSAIRDRPPSDLSIAIVWSGLPIGGIAAALFNYVVIPHHGWQTIFVAGGLLPLPAALIAWRAFAHERSASRSQASRGSVRALFTAGRARRTLTVALMFFFGYVATSVIVAWLPTIMSQSHASPAAVSIAFGALNVGGAAGQYGLGYLSARVRSRHLLVIAWAVTGLFALAAATPGVGLTPLVLCAVASYTVAAGSQALAVGLATRLHPGLQVEASALGFAVSAGRLGQFGALGLSSVLLGLGLSTRALLGMAGWSACAACLAAILVARMRSPSPTIAL